MLMAQFYGYLNPESTKTASVIRIKDLLFYGYLNPESTKTGSSTGLNSGKFYGYLNPESTKTRCIKYGKEY